MPWMSGGTAFTSRVTGSSTGTATQDIYTADMSLASANGWVQLPQNQWPALLDVPDYSVPTNTVGALNGFNLFQTGVPLIMAPTTTPGSSGTFTLGTAGPTGFWGGSCYLYTPASAWTSPANTAGWYYGVLTSTTLGTLYTNTYSSGLPFIPGTAALGAVVPGSAGTWTGVTSAQAGLSFTLPANIMGPNGQIIFEFLLGFHASTNNKTVTIKVGTNTVFSLVEATTGIAAYQGQVIWGNQGNAKAQFCQTVGAPGATSNAQTYTTVDTTTNQTVTVNITNSTATDWVSIDSFSAFVVPG